MTITLSATVYTPATIKRLVCVCVRVCKYVCVCVYIAKHWCEYSMCEHSHNICWSQLGIVFPRE